MPTRATTWLREPVRNGELGKVVPYSHCIADMTRCFRPTLLTDGLSDINVLRGGKPFVYSGVVFLGEWYACALAYAVYPYAAVGPPSLPSLSATNPPQPLAYLSLFYNGEKLNELIQDAISGTDVVAFAVAAAGETAPNGTRTVGNTTVSYRVTDAVLVAASAGAYKKLLNAGSPNGDAALITPRESSHPAIATLGRLYPAYADLRGLVNVTNVSVFAGPAAPSRESEWRVEVRALPPTHWLLVVCVPVTSLNAPLWAAWDDLDAIRTGTRDNITGQHAADSAATNRRLTTAVVVSVIVALAVGALVTVVGGVLFHSLASKLRALGVAMHATASLTSPHDRSFRTLTPSTVAEISLVQAAYGRMAEGMVSFSKYLPIALCRAVVDDGREAALGLSERRVVVLFCDVEDFTAVCVRHADAPNELSECLQGYFEEATYAITALNGSVDQFIGDTVMALWGASDQPAEVPCAVAADSITPHRPPRREADAVAAAVRLQSLVADLRGVWAAKLRGTLLRVRSGINAGRCLVGNIGSATRFHYTALGHTVNVASHLEGVNKVFGTRTIVTADVLTADVAESFPHRLLGAVAVRTAAPVRVYEIADCTLPDDFVFPDPMAVDDVSVTSESLLDPAACGTHSAPAPPPFFLQSVRSSSHSGGGWGLGGIVDTVSTAALSQPCPLPASPHHTGAISGHTSPDGDGGGAQRDLSGGSSIVIAARGASVFLAPSADGAHPALGVGADDTPPPAPPTLDLSPLDLSPRARPPLVEGEGSPPRAPAGTTQAQLRSAEEATLLAHDMLPESASVAALALNRNHSTRPPRPQETAVGRPSSAPMRVRDLAVFSGAATSFLAAEFTDAAASLARLRSSYPDDLPTRILLAEAQRLIANPPGAGWNGALRPIARWRV